MARELLNKKPLLEGATSTGAGNGVNVADFSEVTIEVHTTGGFNGTIDFLVSADDEEPDWSSSADQNSHYTKAQMDKTSDGTTANNTSSSGSDITETWTLKDAGFSYFNVDLSSRSAGTVYVDVKGYE